MPSKRTLLFLVASYIALAALTAKPVLAAVMIEQNDVQSRHHLLTLSGSIQRESNEEHAGFPYLRSNRGRWNSKELRERGTKYCAISLLHETYYRELDACLDGAELGQAGGRDDKGTENNAFTWSRQFLVFERARLSASPLLKLSAGTGSDFDWHDTRRERASGWLETVTARQWEGLALQVGVRRQSSAFRKERATLANSYLLFRPAALNDSESPVQWTFGLSNRQPYLAPNVLSDGYQFFADPHIARAFFETHILPDERNAFVFKFSAGLSHRFGDYVESTEPDQQANLSDSLAGRASVLDNYESYFAGGEIGYKGVLSFALAGERDRDSDATQESLVSLNGQDKTVAHLRYTPRISLFDRTHRLQFFASGARRRHCDRGKQSSCRYTSAGVSSAWHGGNTGLFERDSQNIHHRLAFEYRDLDNTRAENDPVDGAQLFVPQTLVGSGIDNEIALGGYHEFASGRSLTWRLFQLQLSGDGFLQTANKTSEKVEGLRIELVQPLNGWARARLGALAVNDELSFRKTFQTSDFTPIAEQQISLTLEMSLR